VEPGLNTSSALALVSDAITRLQQERDNLQKDHDLWKRRHTELHRYYGDIIKEKEDKSLSYLRQHQQASDDLERTLQHLALYLSAHDTQKLLIKSLQDELGEEAE